jgi:beta-alanine degradation protein BauB
LNSLALCFYIAMAGLSTDSSPVLIDNGQVTVRRVLISPHENTSFCQHGLDCVFVYLQSGTESVRSSTGNKSVLAFQIGNVTWCQASNPNIVSLTSNRPVNVIVVELKQHAFRKLEVSRANPLDPANIDPAHYKTKFENDRVRVLEAKYGPHEIAAMHQHTLNRVVIYITDQESQVTDVDGSTRRTKHKAGDVGWGVAAKHTEQNLGDAAYDVIVVEPKL